MPETESLVDDKPSLNQMFDALVDVVIHIAPTRYSNGYIVIVFMKMLTHFNVRLRLMDAPQSRASVILWTNS